MTGSLAVKNLSVRYGTPQGHIHALRHVDMHAEPGEATVVEALSMRVYVLDRP